MRWTHSGGGNSSGQLGPPKSRWGAGGLTGVTGDGGAGVADARWRRGAGGGLGDGIRRVGGRMSELVRQRVWYGDGRVVWGAEIVMLAGVAIGGRGGEDTTSGCAVQQRSNQIN